MTMALVTKNREQLIDECQGLVRSLAAQIQKSLPRHIEFDDLVGYGQVGLAEAAQNFDPTRGGQFTTFAYYRIRGAILDGVSKMSWVSRAQYSRLKYQRMADEALQFENEEANTSDNIGWLKEVTGVLTVIYLSTHAAPGREGESIDVEDSTSQAPPVAVIERETCRKLHELIDSLPAESRALIRAAYFEGLTLTEAGQRLGIGKAWASRLHARALKRLARALRLAGIAD